MQKNPYLSSLKGFAIVAIMLIHLFDWSNYQTGVDYPFWVRDWLHVFVLFFVALSGSVIAIAYKEKPVAKVWVKIIKRGLQIIGIYYAYTLIKFFLMKQGVYPMMAEPYFMMFQEQGLWTWSDMIFMHSGSVPLGILITIAGCIMVSPMLLWIVQTQKYSIGIISALAIASGYFSFFNPLDIPIVYAHGYSFFAPLPWFTVFLMGFLLGMIGFEQKKQQLLVWFSSLSLASIWWQVSHGKSIFPSWNMYPLQPHYIILGFLVMIILMYVIEFFITYKKYEMIRWKFNFLEIAGNNTLFLYIAHWIAIDITLWATYYFYGSHEYSEYIWYSVGLVGAWFIWNNRKNIFTNDADSAISAVKS